MNKEDKLKIAERLGMKDDKLCHWTTCKCIDNNIKLRLEKIELRKKLKNIEKKIENRIKELDKIINDKSIINEHRHTLIEASIVKSELEKILKESSNE